jgi:hypothetical protein
MVCDWIDEQKITTKTSHVNPHRSDHSKALLDLQLKLQRSHLGHERLEEDFVPVRLEVPPLRYMCHVLERAPQVVGRVVEAVRQDKDRWVNNSAESTTG